MRALFFDRSGDVWPGCPPQTGESVAAAISVHGIVGIKREAMGTVVSFNPRTAHPVAIAAAIAELMATRSRRYLIHTTTEAGNAVAFARCASEAVAIIVKVQAEQRIKDTRHLVRSRVPLGTLAAESNMGAAIRLAGATSPERRQDVLSAFANLCLEGRYIAIEAQDHGNSLLVRDYGAGLAILDYKWRRHGRGLRIEDVPDTDYGRWAGDAYRQAMQGDGPWLFQNDVVVYSPNRARARVHYDLLVLPLDPAGGNRRFLGLSQPTSIDALPS